MLPRNPTYPRPTRADVEIAKLRARVAELEAALREIQKGEGEFSRDHLQHAANVIENSQRIATEALGLPGNKSEVLK